MKSRYSIVHKVPFIRILFPLISGISCYYAFPDVLWIFFPFFFSLVLFGIAFFRDFDSRFYHRSFFGIGVLLFFFGTGALLTQFQLVRTYFPPSDFITASGQIVENPKEKGDYIRFLVKTNEIRNDSFVYAGGKEVIVYAKTESFLTNSLSSGDYVCFTGRFISVDSMEIRNGFDYGAYLKRNAVSGIVFINALNLEKDVRHDISLSVLFENWRSFLLKQYRRLNLSDENFAVLSSITLGDRSDLTDYQRDSFANSGLSHILAISGMHIAILYAVLRLFFCLGQNDKRNSKLREFFVLVFLWLFTLLSGFSASAVRATFMFSLFTVGEILDRRTSSYNILFAVATLMLLLHPFYLFDVSFQLSFAALASILYFYPLLRRSFSTNNVVLLYFRDIVSMSLAAQIGVFPLILFYFGTFPLFFLIANLLVLPLLPLLLSLGWLYLPVSSVPFFDSFFHDVLSLFLGYVNDVMESLSSLPFSVLRVEHFSSWILLLLYMLLAVFIISLEHLKRMRM
ncbi:MAG: ComEC/Rec2 family competence protein [Bacteroidales bacterium]|nr:ComEC/Rec2 family competence protein [Bacteroidales bacterium]